MKYSSPNIPLPRLYFLLGKPFSNLSTIILQLKHFLCSNAQDTNTTKRTVIQIVWQIGDIIS